MKIALFKKYEVDYCGSKLCFKNPKNRYRAGKNVKLYYTMVATDTDYRFRVDEKYMNAGYSEKKGYII